MHSSIWDLPEVAEEAPYGPSGGNMSPDVGDTRRQGMPMTLNGKALWNWIRTMIVRIWRKMNLRIGVTKNWALGRQERQETTSVKCARAHCGLRFATASLRPMCWSCVLLGPSCTVFLMKKKGGDGPHAAPLPEWPSLNFCLGLFKPGKLPDLTAFKDSRERT